MQAATEILLWAIVIHLVVDWLFQNDWMAANKANPKHPAGYVHAGLHAVALCLVLPPWMAFAVGVIHWFIDLRFFLGWWRRFYGQTSDASNPVSLHVAIWGDQVLHILVLAVAALVVGGPLK